MELWTLLPHYSIVEHKLFFLNSIEIPITLTNEIVDYLLLENWINKDSLVHPQSKVIFEVLKNRGILYCIRNHVITDELEKGNILIIQPHCDDFAFSCGATVAMEQSLNRESQAVVMTVFSEYSFLNCPWHDKVVMNDQEYSDLRLTENELCANELNLIFQYLHFEDAGKRSKNTESLFCPDRLHNHDLKTGDIIAEKMEKVFKDKVFPTKVYMPSAIGWHRDHVIVHIAAIKMLKNIHYNGLIYLYEDYPYCDNGRYLYWERLQQLLKLYNMNPIYNHVEGNLKVKANLINYFRSQIKWTNIQEIKKVVTQLSISTGYEGFALGHIGTTNKNYYERVWKLSLE